MTHLVIEHSHMVVTWPKTRPLKSYLDEIERAQREDKYVFFRVPSFPTLAYGARCYHVYDGLIRGWLPIVDYVRSVDMEGPILDPITNAPWPEGLYVVRRPEWTACKWAPKNEMRGFQGFRYLER
jgi:hypothetical protein